MERPIDIWTSLGPSAMTAKLSFLAERRDRMAEAARTRELLRRRAERSGTARDVAHGEPRPVED